jgi:hypothetical protein
MYVVRATSNHSAPGSDLFNRAGTKRRTTGIFTATLHLVDHGMNRAAR